MFVRAITYLPLKPSPVLKNKSLLEQRVPRILGVLGALGQVQGSPGQGLSLPDLGSEFGAVTPGAAAAGRTGAIQWSTPRPHVRVLEGSEDLQGSWSHPPLRAGKLAQSPSPHHRKAACPDVNPVLCASVHPAVRVAGSRFGVLEARSACLCLGFSPHPGMELMGRC